LAAGLAWAAAVSSQPAPFERLPVEQFDMLPPSARVSGPPGRMTVAERACRSVSRDQVRRRLVDLAVQEWAYFGFAIADETQPEADDDGDRRRARDARRRSRLSPPELARLADSIAGYWAVTPEGGWILERQNQIWSRSLGTVADWRDPWSAAFISWLMCEGGLDEDAEFERAIAHYIYIDQAILAREDESLPSAFIAHEVGEIAVEPGDLLCRARRGAYRTLAERRRDLGQGARSHCDLVVELDPASGRILTIGGNVRDSVRLKLLAAEPMPGSARAGVYASIGRGGRAVFAHLKLRADSIGADALETTPTFRALQERGYAEWLEVWVRESGRPGCCSLQTTSAAPGTESRAQPSG
jgi:hypothetical protein